MFAQISLGLDLSIITFIICRNTVCIDLYVFDQIFYLFLFQKIRENSLTTFVCYLSPYLLYHVIPIELFYGFRIIAMAIVVRIFLNCFLVFSLLHPPLRGILLSPSAKADLSCSVSSAGRAIGSQPIGRRFEPVTEHQNQTSPKHAASGMFFVSADYSGSTDRPGSPRSSCSPGRPVLWTARRWEW